MWTPGQGQERGVLITVDGTSGGVAGCRKEGQHHLQMDNGLFNTLARSLPACGISVLQLVYSDPTDFELCMADTTKAIDVIRQRHCAPAEGCAGEGPPVLLLGYSMGGAVALASATRHVAGVCTLASQTNGVPGHSPHFENLGQMDVLVIHGTDDTNVPSRCADEVWARIGRASCGQSALVMVPGAGHSFAVHLPYVTHLVEQWVVGTVRCALLQRKQGDAK